MINVIHKGKESSNTIIIFIHGFTAGEKTWVKEDGSKPLIDKILKDEDIFKYADLALFTYHTKLIELFPQAKKVVRLFGGTNKISNNQPIETISKLLSTEIRYRCGEYRNIVLIGHSMGGLVAKKLILDDIAENTTSKVQLYISLATPHSGSNFASIGKKLIDNCQLENLSPLSETISKLNDDWVHCRSLPKRFYAQGQNDELVPPVSSISLDRDKQKTIYSDDDHSSIVVPESDDHIIVIALKDELRRFIRDARAEEIESETKFTDEGQFDEEVFVLKLLVADVHSTLVNDSKQAFYNADFTIRKLKRVGIDISELSEIYQKIKELYVIEWGGLLSGVHKDSNSLVSAVHKQIIEKDQVYLRSISKPLEGIQKYGMLQQLASHDNDIWWALDNNVKSLSEFIKIKKGVDK